MIALGVRFTGENDDSSYALIVLFGNDVLMSLSHNSFRVYEIESTLHAPANFQSFRILDDGVITSLYATSKRRFK